MKVMLAGGLAGAFSKTCTAPFGRMTILYQLGMLEGQKTSIWGGMRHVVESQVLLLACSKLWNTSCGTFGGKS
jgi:hypothetical protein